ncbi:hypothetical protein GH714_003126 [Hevea brasiliensis]|uniref:Transcription factor CBF/NF-Y/archaeal histone domain-containing protein n=1 Tax=Hevea brasiliensis TaxID=3981 RepID=A0A6A6LB69_HEVBR|nr:hypothetical protein GH714_003126 [Hevea brasiliensis]
MITEFHGEISLVLPFSQLKISLPQIISYKDEKDGKYVYIENINKFTLSSNPRGTSDFMVMAYGDDKKIGRSGPHSLPLARIKKIMKKSGDDVKMISGEAPIVFSKACELFIEELTQRSWMVTMQGKRRTLHKDDVASAVIATDIFDFLVNLVDNNSSNSMDNPEDISS